MSNYDKKDLAMKPIAILRKILTAGFMLTLLSLLPALSQGADQCVNPTGTEGCFTSIQAAIDAASAGDTVTIGKGVYLQQFDVPVSSFPGGAKAGLTVMGQKSIKSDKSKKSNKSMKKHKVIIDPEISPFGDGIDVFADGVTLSSFTLRNGTRNGIHVNFGANDTLIEDVFVTGADTDCVLVEDGPTRLDAMNIRGCGSQGVDAQADDIGIFDSVISNADRGTIISVGERIEIVDNDIRVSEDSECIDHSGNNARIEGNTISSCDTDGIDARGDNIVIKDNDIFAVDFQCIDGDGDNVLITDNVMASCSSGGVDWFGAEPTVDNNSVEGANDEGYIVDCVTSCFNGRVSNNKVTDVPDDDSGFDISALTGFLVDGNSAKRVADEGFSISGSGITIQNNKSSGNGGDKVEGGFEIFGSDHTLNHNEAKANHGDGFSINGSGHTLIDNKSKDNVEDGFDVKAATAIVFNGNEAKNNNGVGFEVSAGSSVTLSGNEAKDNRIPFCSDSAGGITDGGANNFMLVGAPACIIGD